MHRNEKDYWELSDIIQPTSTIPPGQPWVNKNWLHKRHKCPGARDCLWQMPRSWALKTFYILSHCITRNAPVLSNDLFLGNKILANARGEEYFWANTQGCPRWDGQGRNWTKHNCKMSGEDDEINYWITAKTGVPECQSEWTVEPCEKSKI